ncbi:MAG: hypothetical protein PHP42_03505 [Bacteroidota bacterium]|nr:hypothetical protein [Bacteroidota bacterium]
MIFPPFFLYAETHYRFKYFLSFLKKSEPEILVDAPHRLDPDAALPIMLLVKDADTYPIDILSITVFMHQGNKQVYQQVFDLGDQESVASHYWWKIFSVPFTGDSETLFGLLTVDVEIRFRQNNKIKTIRNNNYRTSSKTPLKIYRSKTHLPLFPGWIYGDAHTHSTLTEDQVEFGSPIAASPTLCKAMGLSFFCVTDHSYDLDDRLDNYLVNDPTLPKWNQLHQEVDDCNQKENNFVVVRGEEVSCTNSDGRNVHLLLLGTRKFFHGSGDSAEKWLRTNCEHTAADVLFLKDRTVAAFAGHPTEEVPFIQQLLINRGEWTKKDMSNEYVNGIQILNGEYAESFINGLDVWKWLLLKGEKKFILAGNDAHGNFNRFIQIGMPFVSIREKENQLFGKMKTALFSSLSEERIVSAIQYGNSVITNGPMLTIELETESNNVGKIGESITGRKFLVKIHAVSTREFGKFRSLKIISGTVGKKERNLYEWKNFTDPLRMHLITDWETVTSFSYIRAEAFTYDADGIDGEGFCYTNPIWIQPE